MHALTLIVTLAIALVLVLVVLVARRVASRHNDFSPSRTEISPAAYRAQMWEMHRPAFDICRRTMELLETWIATPRAPENTISKVVDLLFLQCYKSFSGVYLLAVSGQGEDAGTIARRLLELTWQLMALSNSSHEQHREEWAKRCLAYFFAFWPQMEATVAASWTDEERRYWAEAYSGLSHLIELDQYDWPLNWWPKVDSAGSIQSARGRLIHLATLVGARDSYENDYRILSQMAHGLTSGFLFDLSRGKIEIRSGRMIGTLVLWATSYVLIAASVWNLHFSFLPEEKLDELRREAIAMKKDFNRRAGT